MNSEENNIVKKHQKVKFYHKTIFLIVASIIIFIAGFAAGTPGYYETKEVTGSSNNEESTESVESTLIPIDLTTGTWTCGVDIAPGRYVATVPEGGMSGNLYITGSTNKTYETIGPSEFSVPSVTVTLEEGDTIEIVGTEAVHFEPVQ